MVSIPNPFVKPLWADGSEGAALCESRYRPGSLIPP